MSLITVRKVYDPSSDENRFVAIVQGEMGQSKGYRFTYPRVEPLVELRRMHISIVLDRILKMRLFLGMVDGKYREASERSIGRD
jgi:hypothetical protein